jgi:hypothetical protein
MKNTLHESNSYEQMILFNQLREYLNQMCLGGYLGSFNARACQSIVDILHQSTENHLELTNQPTNAEHDRHKRFFCNGFIGCKNAGR